MKKRPADTLFGLFVGLILGLVLGMFAAIAAAQQPAQEEMKLGAGDVVRITVYNNPDLTTETDVAEGGSIAFPLIGEVPVGGLSPSAAARQIADRLTKGKFIPNAQVNLRILEQKSRMVSVLGEVAKPGKYPVTKPSNLTELIAAAGGITERGSGTVSIVKRTPEGATKRHTVSVKTLLSDAADPSKEILIDGGDVVFVPVAPQFYIYGEVRKPGAYPLADGLTVTQALSVGGGLTIRGTERGISIERLGPDGKRRKFRPRASEKLSPDDVVRVPESWF